MLHHPIQYLTLTFAGYHMRDHSYDTLSKIYRVVKPLTYIYPRGGTVLPTNTIALGRLSSHLDPQHTRNNYPQATRPPSSTSTLASGNVPHDYQPAGSQQSHQHQANPGITPKNRSTENSKPFIRPKYRETLAS